MTRDNDKTDKTVRSAHLQLTEEQKKQLEEIFGSEMIARLERIQLEQVAGFLKADMIFN